VTRPQGIRIASYQVIVTAEAPPGGGFQADLPATATNIPIPAGVLARGAEYAVEVIARASSGNQTLTEVGFRTAR
jgi:hypothetical protein